MGVKSQRPAGRPFMGIASGPSLYYAIVPDEIPFVNKGRLWSGDQLVKRAPRLVICQDRVRNEFNLLLCDRRWRITACVGAMTIEETRNLAESFYPGLSPHWVDLGLTEKAAEQYMERLRRSQGCLFCRRTPAEHGGTQVQVGRVRICSQCVQKFYKDLCTDDRS